MRSKNLPARLAEIAAREASGKPIEIWWQDEARIGQNNKITRRGTRPSAPKDQRTKLIYLFGAICPALGKAAGLVLPFCNTAAMAVDDDNTWVWETVPVPQPTAEEVLARAKAARVIAARISCRAEIRPPSLLDRKTRWQPPSRFFLPRPCGMFDCSCGM